MCDNQWWIQDFPEEGAPTLQGGRQHTILPNFPKNCMKLKEFGPPGGGARPKCYYVDPPLIIAEDFVACMQKKKIEGLSVLILK